VSGRLERRVGSAAALDDEHRGRARDVSETREPVDALIVGAGFAGLYALHRLRTLGLTARVIEAADGVGGTWYLNCYPGARCDVESLDYSYSFSDELEQDWDWSERYPAQPEVLRYLDHVADRFELRPDIVLGTRVTAATYQEDAGRWLVETDSGGSTSAQHLVLAVGNLSAAQIPDIPGLDSFAGDWLHTASWPRDGVDFTGKRVGVVGTGSTGIQAIPPIAEQAERLVVFQRTANFTIPTRNRPLDPELQRQRKAGYREHRAAARASFLGVPLEGTGKSALAVPPEERQREYEAKWEAGGGMPMLSTYIDLLVDREANDTLAEFFRAKIRATVHDPAVAELLCPQRFPLGAKRLAQDTGYYETFNRDNVTLVDLRATPIEEITPTGLRTSNRAFELDAIVFATGFDAITGAVLSIDIRGRGGRALTDKWADGPRAYLGLAAAGFPNLFVITGPGSPAVLSNVVLSIEQHVDWIADCIAYLREREIPTIEATETAEDAWLAHVGEVANGTLFPQADSWYTGSNIPGKPRVFMPYIGGVAVYRELCDDVAAKGYEGFVLGA
jgi:cation diffusion facilitator CzcD-associated flavoprotein CzcO